MTRTIVAALAASFMTAAGAAADTADGTALIGKDWEKIVEAARGGEVNFFMWGGADPINAYVTEYIGGLAKARYGITLKQVPVTDTVEVVNIVLGEKEAGNVDAGSVDLVWINGENFRTMKQAGLAWCGYVRALPNDALVDWTDPAVANDFGVPVEGCEVPWSRAQFAFAHDSAAVASPPRTMGDLLAWIRENPGRFTYPAPPDFTGSVFVRHVFYHAAGGAEGLLGDFDAAKYDAAAAKTWAILNEIEPFLWREGATYPTSVNQMNELFANGEVDFTFNYEPSQFGLAVDAGTWPETVRSFGLADGTIGNTNYTAIPFNSPNKAAAMVVQNLLLSAEAQLEKARPGVWGAAPAIDMSRAPADIRSAFAALPAHPSVVPAAELAAAALPELQAEWIAAIERGWIEAVGR
jgi:putative spermidine/putrescine transport system substrate-binding protein